MTVIAWDGKTLAADKRSVCASRASTVTKIFRVNGVLLGVSGDFARGMELVEWYRSGADATKLPAFQRDNTDYVPMIMIRPDGCFMYEQAGAPFRIEEPFYAIGSGRDFALAAMHLGQSARDAVLLANELSTGCGNGVDTLQLD